jgi:hypothetical protein
MINIEIQAEDYYVADAMSDLVRRIESEDLLDSVYEDRTDMITIHEEKYTATISKINEEKTPTTTSDNKQNMIEDCKLYAGLEYEINDLWNGDGYDTEKGIVTAIGIERFTFTNNKILHQFETYDEIDEEVLCNILEAVKKNPIVVKMAHTYLEDDESEYGGIAFMGETLLDFLLSIPMSLTSTKEEVNKALKECGIREI